MTKHPILRLCAGIIAYLAVCTTPLFAQGVCTVCSARDPVLLSKTEPVFRDTLDSGWQIDPYGSAYVVPGSFSPTFAVLGLNFANGWESLSLKREHSLDPCGLKALVFRIRDRENNGLRELKVVLKNTNWGWLELVSIIDHMITPPVTGFDPNEWYTVVIPMETLNPYMESFRGMAFQTGGFPEGTDAQEFLLDDIWFVAGMEFPLKGYTPKTAPISSVFDHTMSDGEGNIAPYKKDRVVTVYTGEVADGGAHEADSTCIARDTPLSTDMSNYDGAGVCDLEAYLSYDGHPGIDYAVADVPVYPVAEGTVVPGRCWTYNAGGTCTGWGAVGVDHGNGYMSQYWHMRDIKVEAGAHVSIHTVLGTASDVGIPNAFHLHFEIALKSANGYVHVDPYGWTGIDPDPYRVKGVSVPPVEVIVL